MKTPTFYGRPMVLVKKYKYFVLYQDKKTGIKEAFRYWDLYHKKIDGKTNLIDNKGNIVSIVEVKKIEKKLIKNDTRLSKLINSLNNSEVK